MTSVVRIAAVGDVHVGLDTGPVLGPPEQLAESADLLLVAGDLTRRGTPAEAEVLAAELRQMSVPVIAILGNHDYESDAADDVREIIAGAGATVLDGDSATIEVGDVRVGVAGTPGFGGGFQGASCSEFGEPLMKAFVAHTRAMATALCRSLTELDTDVRVAMTHYSPIEATLVGERLEIYPFLGQLPARRGDRHRRRPPRRARPRPPRVARRGDGVRRAGAQRGPAAARSAVHDVAPEHRGTRRRPTVTRSSPVAIGPVGGC